jgi:hypothetical protein
MKKFLCFDIETAPLPESELLAMLPPFNPDDVKLGNLKDADKIAAKLAEAEASHKADFIDRAALDALTGRVLAIGLSSGTPTILDGEGDESQLLADFWDTVQDAIAEGAKLIGFNCNTFDLPFLYKRSWKHGIRPAVGLRRGRYWSDTVIDLREEWQLGDRMAKGSLDAVAKHLGLGGKTGNGKDFAKLWESDRAAAEKYLLNDIALTEAVAKRMGVN